MKGKESILEHINKRELILKHVEEKKLDINETLKNHFLYSSGTIANYLRIKCDGLSTTLEDFFKSRSNIERITTAIEVIKILSRINDMDDQLPFIALTANIEYLRVLSYGKQRDHISHTLNNFLLGIYLIDCNDGLYNSIKEDRISKICIDEDEYTVNYFILEWMYASVFHDVGYAISELLQENKKETIEKSSLSLKKEITSLTQNLFSSKYAYDYIKDEFEMNEEIAEKIKNFYEEYNLNFNYTADSIIDFFGESGYMELIKDLFESFEETDDLYRINGVLINKNGYINHALIGGLIIYKYVVHWYKLYDYLETNNIRRISEYKYNNFTRAAIREGIVCIALHDNNDKISFNQNSILYLAVLCDELQVWDRYASGNEAISAEISHLVDIQNCSMKGNRSAINYKMEANEIDLACFIDVKLNKKLYFITSSNSIEEKLTKNLTDKLEGFNTFIEIANTKWSKVYNMKA